MLIGLGYLGLPGKVRRHRSGRKYRECRLNKIQALMVYQWDRVLRSLLAYRKHKKQTVAIFLLSQTQQLPIIVVIAELSNITFINRISNRPENIGHANLDLTQPRILQHCRPLPVR